MCASLLEHFCCCASPIGHSIARRNREDSSEGEHKITEVVAGTGVDEGFFPRLPRPARIQMVQLGG